MKNKKFVAGSLTAAMVASVVAPVVAQAAPVALKVEKVTVVDAATIKVKFNTSKNLVVVKLTKKLVHGDASVSFKYAGKSFTAKVPAFQEATFVAAVKAVNTYKAAKLTSLDEVAAAKKLQVAANAALAKVKNATAAQLNAQKAAVAAKAKLVAAAEAELTPAATLTVGAVADSVKAAKLTVAGSVSGAKKVTVNGVEVAVANGSFSTELTLVEGNNTVTVVATNAFGKETKFEKVVKLDTIAPTLAVNVAEVVKEAKLVFAGTVEAGAKVVVNGVEVPVANGAFSKEFTLVEGNTTFTVTAIDAVGNITTVTKVVKLDTTPVVSEVSSVTKTGVTVKVSAGNGADKSKYKLTVDGKEVVVTAVTPDASDLTGKTFKLSADLYNLVGKVAVNGFEYATAVDFSDKVAPVVTAVASVDVTAASQKFTFTVADDKVALADIVVKQGETALTVTEEATANTYAVVLNEVKGANQTLTIDVKDGAGNVATQAKVTLVDKAKPTITKVEALNNKTILVTYSEPVADSALTVTGKYSLYNKTNGVTNDFVSTNGVSDLFAVATFANAAKTQVKFVVSAGTSLSGFPQTGLSNGGYILYTTGLQDRATVANTITASTPYEFTGTLSPDTVAPAFISSSFNSASGVVTLTFDKNTTGATPADDKVYFQVGTTKVLLKNATDYTGKTGTSTVSFTVSAATLAAVNALGGTPQIVIEAGTFTDGANTTAAVITTPTIVTAPTLSSVTYDENTNTAVYKFSKTIDVSEIVTFVGSKFVLGGVDIQDAGLVFNNTADSTELSFKLSNAKAQAVETALRAGTLTASVAAGTVKDTDATANSNVAASSSVALVVGTTYVKDTAAPTLVSSKYNQDSKVVELTFSEAVRNNISDFVNASVEFYKDDNGVAGIQTTTVNGVVADTKIATFADTDLLSTTDTHAINDTPNYFVTNATGATPATTNAEALTIYVKDTDATGTENLDDSLDAAISAGKEIYVNILAGGVKDANTNATTTAQSAKITSVAVSNTTAITSANTTLTSNSLGQITVNFANANGAVAMDSAAATNPANYDLYLGTNPLSKVSIKNIVLNANRTSATIFLNSPLTASSVYGLKTTGLLTATGVSSNLTTEVTVTATANVSALDATQNLVLTDKDNSGSVNAGDEVTLVFSEAVKLPSNFSLSNVTVNNSHSLGSSTYTLGTDNKTLKITIGSGSTLAVGDTLTLPTTITDFENVALASGVAQTTNALTVSGNTAPTILSTVYADTNADGVVSAGDLLTVKFNQNVAITSGKTAADLVNDIVEVGTTFTAATLVGDTLTLTVGTAGFVVGDSVDVNSTASDVDLVNSWITKVAPTAKTITSADVTAPTVTGVKYKASTSELTFTFSESVNDITKVNANDLAAALAADLTVSGGALGGAFTAATLSSDKKSVTITLNGSEALDQFSTVLIAAGTFGNASNNLQDAAGKIAVRGQGTAYTLQIVQ